jgi:transposase
MPHLSKQIQQNIHSLLQQGFSTRQVANRCGVSQSTVQRLRMSNPTRIAKPLPGHPRKLSTQDVNACIRAVTSGRIETAAAATKMLHEGGSIVSDRTVHRMLNEAGLKATEKIQKPKLSRKNVRARLHFAQQHRDWTVADWRKVIWSDETKMNRFNPDGQGWCWTRNNNRLQPHHVKQTVKHGGGSLMIWGCMTIHGTGYMAKITGNMDQHLYKEILEDDLLETIAYYNMDPAKVIFQHDNDSKHTAKLVQEWLNQQPFEVLDWPAQSPDLNPIEHLWAMLKRRLNQYETPPSGMTELWDRVQEQWNAITVNECERLIESMPRRIEAVLKAKGLWTDY